MDGAKAVARFIHVVLPHLYRPISVLIMLETIFFLTIYAEIYVTTGGGPGIGDDEHPVLHLFAGLDGLRRRARFGRGRVRDPDRQHHRVLLCARHVGAAVMARAAQKKQDTLRTVLGWAVGIVMAFPVFWMALAAFKTEQDAAAIPPKLFFSPTVANFVEMNDRVGYLSHAWNSVAVSATSTAIAILLAAPAAYVMAFHPTKRTRSLMLWMLSVRFMPAVGVLIPIYLILVNVGLIDTKDRLDRDHLPQQPAADRLDAVLLLQGGAGRDPRGRADGWRPAADAAALPPDPADRARHRVDGAPRHDPRLERVPSGPSTSPRRTPARWRSPSPPSPTRKGSSGRSSRPRRSPRSPRSCCSAGSPSASWCAG